MTESPTRSGLRVLIVDDDHDQRRLLGRLFTLAGIVELCEARDADEAVERASVHQPDLIVLDLAMPGRSGLEVLPELRLRAEHAQVVVLSNLPQGHYAHQAAQCGAVGYVEKRVAHERLVAEILTAAALSDVARLYILCLDADVAAVRTGRRFVTSVLSDADAAIAGDVELLVSELITNAIIHTSSEPRLEIRISPRTVRVDVYDADPSPATVRVPDVNQPGGRGLQLMATLATRWGSHPVADGKVVWFELSRLHR